MIFGPREWQNWTQVYLSCASLNAFDSSTVVKVTHSFLHAYLQRHSSVHRHRQGWCDARSTFWRQTISFDLGPLKPACELFSPRLWCLSSSTASTDPEARISAYISTSWSAALPHWWPTTAKKFRTTWNATMISNHETPSSNTRRTCVKPKQNADKAITLA